jgi:hypothetical protein
MSEELKPCPFCHSDNVFHLESRLPGYDKYLYFVNCASCDANGPTNKESVEQAIYDWNAWAKPIGKSEELPEWVVTQIERVIMPGSRTGNQETRTIVDTLKWVLSLRGDE